MTHTTSEIDSLDSFCNEFANQARETREVLQENVINAGGARINESIEEVNQPSADIFLHPVMDFAHLTPDGKEMPG